MVVVKQLIFKVVIGIFHGHEIYFEILALIDLKLWKCIWNAYYYKKYKFESNMKIFFQNNF